MEICTKDDVLRLPHYAFEAGVFDASFGIEAKNEGMAAFLKKKVEENLKNQ